MGNHESRLASVGGREETDVVYDFCIALVREQVEPSRADGADDESLTVGENCSYD